jgi:hypothetical protein
VHNYLNTKAVTTVTSCSYIIELNKKTRLSLLYLQNKVAPNGLTTDAATTIIKYKQTHPTHRGSHRVMDPGPQTSPCAEQNLERAAKPILEVSKTEPESRVSISLVRQP